MERYAIFDMDGTLTDSMPVWQHAAENLLRRLGKAPQPDLLQRLAALNEAESAEYLCRTYGLTMTAAQLRCGILETVAEGYRQVSEKPGLRRVLDGLAAQGVAMCVVTSTCRELMQPLLERLELLPYFRFTISCGNGQGKDRPDVYLEAMARLGAQEPGQVAVFEDAAHAVCTASAAGFAVYAVADPSAQAPKQELAAMAKQYLNSWDELDITVEPQ